MNDTLLEKVGFSIPEACHVSSCGRSKLYESLATGELAARKLGKRTIILREDLLRFLDSLPVANAKPPATVAGRSETPNRTAFAPRKQRPAVVGKPAQT
jgi:excisionase family DNA binding protein